MGSFGSLFCHKIMRPITNEINNEVQSESKLKIGFDIHGVLDTFPSIVAMLKALARSDIEIHIVTGQKYDHSIKGLLDEKGIRFDRYFSIVEYLTNKGVPVEWKNGLPYADKAEWNKAKKEYCAANGINILFDDSPTYMGEFHDSKTVYCLVNNPSRKIYETRS